MTSTPRTDPPNTGDEFATLTGFLEFLRETIAAKTDGLDADQLARTHPPSTMTLGGMLKHLSYVEDWWANQVLAGNPPAPPWDTAPFSEDDDWDWHSAVDDSPEELRELWRATADRSREVLAAGDLDRVSVLTPHHGPVSARWVLVHLIEEYGRHCGHADLIRESIDGTTGE